MPLFGDGGSSTLDESALGQPREKRPLFVCSGEMLKLGGPLRNKYQVRHFILSDKGKGMYIEWMKVPYTEGDAALGGGIIVECTNNFNDMSFAIGIEGGDLIRRVTTKKLVCFSGGDFEMWSRAFGIKGML